MPFCVCRQADLRIISIVLNWPPMDVVKLLENKCADSDQVTVARELNISTQYLNDVLRKRKDPGPRILEALGVGRRTVYFWLSGKRA